MLHETLKIDGTFRSKILQNKKKILRPPMSQSVGGLTNVAKAKYGNKKKHITV